PESSFSLLLGRGKRTRFTPAWPATAKRPTTRQTGASCSTTKTSRDARGRTNLRTVVRRRFGPVALIHVREVCPRVTSWPEGSPAPVADAPKGDGCPPALLLPG